MASRACVHVAMELAIGFYGNAEMGHSEEIRGSSSYFLLFLGTVR
jgi:hypothetical protein